MPDNSSSSDSLEHVRQEPLHMLGGMVSPHLVQAKASLCHTLSHCLYLAEFGYPAMARAMLKSSSAAALHGSRLRSADRYGRRQALQISETLSNSCKCTAPFETEVHLVCIQDHFAAALKDVVNTVNARHGMAQAIALYAELQKSAQSPRRKPG